MFWNTWKEVLEELRSQRSVRATLERQIRRLEMQNRDLMNRLMARNFIDYVQAEDALRFANPVEQQIPIYNEEDLAGTFVED